MSGRLALLAGIGVGFGVPWLFQRAARRKRGVLGELEPWEREALAVGPVGVPEGRSPDIDEVPVGAGLPSEHCLGLVSNGDGEVARPYCIFNPLEDPRFAPVSRGAPPSALGWTSTWPLRTDHPGRLLVSYWTAAGPRGYSSRAFGARRLDNGDGHRHTGIDLFANAGDIVVAPEVGRVLDILPFHAGTWAVYLRSRLGKRVINLAEVERGSWREFGVRPGKRVREGQPLARVGVQAGGSAMLHVETYAVGEHDDEILKAVIRGGELRWPEGELGHGMLRDPSAYLVTAATRTYRRERLLD